MNYISTYCRIGEDYFTVNNALTALDKEESFTKNLTSLYKKLELSYPKYHKMDLLSKVAVLGTQLLLNANTQLNSKRDDEIALFFANSESSEYSDKKFYNSYTKEANPSPSHFVYTLPNILIGEIAIKNKWYGENLFLIFPKFDAKEMVEQLGVLLQGETTACVCGWVNVTQDQVDAFFFVAEKTPGENSQELSEGNLLKLYQDHYAGY